MKVVWSEHAKESLAKIYDYIDKDSPQNAQKVFNTLLEIGNSLANPRIEYSKDLILDDERFRSFSKWNYKIVYERTNQKVIILDIFSTKQNPDKLLNL